MRIEPIAFLNAIRDPDRAKDNAFVTLFFVLAALSFSIAFFEFFSMVFIIFAAIAWWRDKRPGLFAEAAWIFLALYLGAALLSLTQTDYPQASWRGIFKVVRQAALCAGAFAVIDSPKKFKRIFVWLLIIGGVISADAVLQWLVGFDLIRSRRMTPFSAQTQRVTATFSHANDFASFLCIVTPCYLTVAAGGFKRLFSPKFSVIFYAGLVLSLAALLGTFSRGAWIAVAAAAVLLALLRPNRLLVALCLGVIVWM
ncbi:MAG: hypothetical protein WCG06_00335, partial [Candidatus Omnitrophota bacterium]